MAVPLRSTLLKNILITRSIISRSFTGAPGYSCQCLRNITTTSRPQLLSSDVTNSRVLINPVRTYSYFTKIEGDELWQGVIGVSNAGKKRGRGKRVGRKRTTDLNRGQVFGTGKANILWPGLNTPILKGREVVRQKQLPKNPDYQDEIVKMRDQMSKIRHPALPPLLRGFAGNKFPGQSVGPPDPVADYKFDGFDTRVLEFKLVTNMTGTLGRKMQFTAFVVTGNKNGIAGFGDGKGQSGKAAIRVAKNRAAQNLHFVERLDDHTVYHNMFVKYHKTKVFIHRKESGYGLKCHRVLRTICDLMGIKDLHCKVEGSTKNVKALTKGFFQVVSTQETHQKLADRMNLHVVSFSKERENLPQVVASPSHGIVSQEPYQDEEQDIELDYDRLFLDGKVELRKPRKPMFYEKLRSFKIKKGVVHKRRNQHKVQVMRMAGVV